MPKVFKMLLKIWINFIVRQTDVSETASPPRFILVPTAGLPQPSAELQGCLPFQSDAAPLSDPRMLTARSPGRPPG